MEDAGPPQLLSVDLAAANRAAAQGEALRAAGKFAAAREHYEAALRLQPDDAQFHFVTALCDWEMGQRDSARRHAHIAVTLNPRFAVAHRALGQWYLQEGIIEAALEFSARAAALMPDDPGVATSRAFVLEGAGELDAAWEIVQRLIDGNFTPPMLTVLYARMSRRRGREEHALALIKLLLVDKPPIPREESALNFAAANLLDAMGRYDEAFAHAARGNELRRPRYDAGLNQRTFDGIIAYFTQLRLCCLPKAMYRSEKPVFILGMPRSGTSLVEQILASHPQVHGAGELDFINRVFLGTLGMLSATVGDYPACLDRLSVDKADGMAQIYLEPLVALNRAAARITDKLPLNFLHLGLISLLLPDARVIHCRRDPLDTCLSCYMTDLSGGHDFKYDLTHLGLFYRQYERLMEHWKRVLELQILDVHYEELIAGPEVQSRRMVEFLGLPWDERCLRFHETKRAVATASGEQVRRPIYDSSVNRWRRYEKYLTPLKQALVRR